MKTAELQKLIIDTLEEHKAIDITPVDVTSLTDIMDTMIICTAGSNRHALALADKVVRASKKAGVRPIGTEGETSGEWILIDLVDIIVHIMLQDAREFYSLEKLWSLTESSRQNAHD